MGTASDDRRPPPYSQNKDLVTVLTYPGKNKKGAVITYVEVRFDKVNIYKLIAILFNAYHLFNFD